MIVHLRRLVILSLCVWGIARAQDTGTGAEQLAVVSPMRGDVSVWHADAGKAGPCVGAARLTRRDHVGSRGGGIASIGVEGSVVVTLKGVEAAADQGLSVSKSEEKIVLELVRGSAVVESAETDISFVTPQGEIAGRGVSFLVEVTGDSARVVALDGTPTFANDLGSVEVPAGSAAAVAGNGQAPGEPAPVDVDRDASWALRAQTESNLVVDPGFEFFPGGEKAVWVTKQDPSLLHVDSAQRHGGARSLRIDLRRTLLKGHDDGQIWPILYQQRSNVLQEKARYFFRLWMRTEGLARDGVESRLKVAVTPDWHQVPVRVIECPSMEGEWRCVRLFFQSTGRGFILETPRLDPKGTYDGKIWIDDLFLGLVAPKASDAGEK